jgi:hypothetical protein
MTIITLELDKELAESKLKLLFVSYLSKDVLASKPLSIKPFFRLLAVDSSCTDAEI